MELIGPHMDGGRIWVAVRHPNDRSAWLAQQMLVEVWIELTWKVHDFRSAIYTTYPIVIYLDAQRPFINVG